MSSADLIASLDNALAVRGNEDIKLRRSVGVTNKSNVDVDIRAKVNSPSANQLVGDVQESDLFCIFSPTEINNAQWPGGHLPTSEDVRIPSKTLGDQIYARGRWRAVQWAQGFYPSGELCRIEARIRG